MDINLNNNTINSANETEVVVTKKRTASKSLLATNDASLIVQADFVAERWALRPEIIIGRATREIFIEILSHFKAAGNSRHLTSGKRTDITLRLSEMDTLIGKVLRFVKHYAEEEYGYEDVFSHLYKYGIIKISGIYILPQGRDERLVAMKQLIDHLTVTGYVTNKYGANYWQALYDEYSTLLKASKEKEGTQSRTAGEKGEAREQVRLILRDIAKILEILHPTDYISVQKEWGFLKSRN